MKSSKVSGDTFDSLQNLPQSVRSELESALDQFTNLSSRQKAEEARRNRVRQKLERKEAQLRAGTQRTVQEQARTPVESQEARPVRPKVSDNEKLILVMELTTGPDDRFAEIISQSEKGARALERERRLSAKSLALLEELRDLVTGMRHLRGRVMEGPGHKVLKDELDNGNPTAKELMVGAERFADTIIQIHQQAGRDHLREKEMLEKLRVRLQRVPPASRTTVEKRIQESLASLPVEQRLVKLAAVLRTFDNLA